MKRVDTPELLDSGACSAEDVQESLRDLVRINRWFGGVATTQALIEQVARATGLQRFSVLDVAAGTGEVSQIVQKKLARRGITIDVTLLDRAWAHLPKPHVCKPQPSMSAAPRPRITSPGDAVVADALALPFCDSSFDLVTCNLFAHHLNPEALARFVREAWRVSRVALLINDLVRHPLHLALVYAGFPLMQSAVSRFDGVASVRRSYVPAEIREVVETALRVHTTYKITTYKIDVRRYYLFRMGVTVLKGTISENEAGAATRLPHHQHFPHIISSQEKLDRGKVAE